MNNENNSPKQKPKPKPSSWLSCCANCKCFISIWSTWYSLLILALHSYLIKTHIDTILKLTNYYYSTELSSKFTDWSLDLNSSSPNDAYLNYLSYLTFNYDSNINDALNNSFNQIKAEIYYEIVTRICLLSASVLFLVLFVVCSIAKVGNYANDEVKFGRDFFYEKLHAHLNPSKRNAKQSLNEELVKRAPYSIGESSSITSTSSNAITADIASLSSASLTFSSSCSLNKKNKCCLTRLIKSVYNLFEVLWRHFLPTSSFFHFVSIFLLILADLIYTNSNKIHNTR